MGEQPQSWEDRKAELAQMVTEAEQQALSEAEIDRYQEQIDEATNKLMSGKLTLEQFNSTTAELDGSIGSVFVDTLPEYRFVLECAGFSPDEVEDTLAHENDHMLIAQDVPGADLCYQLQFMRTEQGVAMRPSVRIDWPDGVQDEAARERIMQCLAAPDELSDSDKRTLSELT